MNLKWNSWLMKTKDLSSLILHREFTKKSTDDFQGKNVEIENQEDRINNEEETEAEALQNWSSPFSKVQCANSLSFRLGEDGCGVPGQ